MYVLVQIKIFMPEDTTGVVDTKPKVENHSKKSITWLKFLQHKLNVDVRHALNGGEVNLPDIGKVDGFCDENNTLYEFQGCYWHGCTKCFSGHVVNKHNRLDMRYLRDQTSRKNALIRREYSLVEMWECHLRYDTEFKKFDKPEYVTQLDPRDAFLVVEQKFSC